jgi:hypothetical protein
MVCGCEQRAVGGVDDGGVSPDRAVDGRVDARVDAARDARPDAAPGCTVPEEMTIIENPTEPCFVMGLDRLSSGHYVLGGAQGWQDLQAHLWLLDQDTLEILDKVPVSAEMVFPTVTEADTVWVVTEDDNDVTLQSFAVSGSEITSGHGAVSLCNYCAPAWQGPVRLGDRVFAATHAFGDEEITLYAVNHTGSIGETEVYAPFPGEDPRLAADGTYLYIFYLHDEQIWVRVLDAQGTQVGSDYTLATPAAIYPCGATAALEGGAWGAYNTGSGQLLEMRVGRVDTTGAVGEWASFHVAMGAGLELSMVEARSMVGLTWGENYGEGRVGAHFVALSGVGPEILAADTVISPPVDRISLSHAVWSAIAAHPQGFLVAWGGWNEETNHGIYAKRIVCNP